jgi:hypothetical protein
MTVQRLLSSLCLMFCVATTCVAQPAYTIGQYLRDQAVLGRVDTAYRTGNVELALELHRTLGSNHPVDHYWRAQLIWHTGGAPTDELKKAFDLGYRYIPSATPDSFEVAMREELRLLEEQAAVKRDQHRIQRCEELIDRDQVLANAEYDEAGVRTNLDTLDALIREGGWPSSHALSGIGVAIVLAHQKWDEAHHFKPYQALIEAECRAGRENWQVAISTLEQRIRYTARNKTDTIAFMDKALEDDDPALPMVVAISHRLVANGHKQVWIHAADTSIALAVADRIIEVQPETGIPQETLDMLKTMHVDHPAPLTMERIALVVDPTLPNDRFLYRMN